MKATTDSGYAALISPVPDRTHFTRPWLPSRTRHFPLLPLSAVLVVVLCIVATITILLASDGKTIDEWPTGSHPVQPAVLIAIFVAIANTALSFLLFEGVQRAWWQKALQGGTVSDLHRYWSFGTSAIAAASSGKSINLIALANLFTTIVIINGPLLQRSSTVSAQNHTSNVTIFAQLSSQPLPTTFGTSAENTGSYLLSPSFLKVIQEYNKHNPIHVGSTGCTGSCLTTLEASGFDYQCNTTTNQSLILEPAQEAQVMSSRISYTPTSNPGSLQLNMTFIDGLSSTSNFSMRYNTNAPLCTTSYTSVVCNLRPAQVKYPAALNKGIAMLGRWSPDLNETITFQDVSSNSSGTPAIMRAMATAAGTLFNASANLTLDTDAIDMDGMLGTLYMKQSNQNATSCNIAWSNPTVDVINAIRELMFRTAVSASNTSTTQEVLAQQTSIRAVYVSHYSWLGGAIAVTFLNLMALIPLFVGWWHLGRSVSLSPIETAKAFEAPLLHGDAYNADVDLLLKEVGRRRVRYGEAAFVESSGRRLRIGEPSQTVSPKRGQLYGASHSRRTSASMRQWRDI